MYYINKYEKFIDNTCGFYIYESSNCEYIDVLINTDILKDIGLGSIYIYDICNVT